MDRAEDALAAVFEARDRASRALFGFRRDVSRFLSRVESHTRPCFAVSARDAARFHAEAVFSLADAVTRRGSPVGVGPSLWRKWRWPCRKWKHDCKVVLCTLL